MRSREYVTTRVLYLSATRPNFDNVWPSAQGDVLSLTNYAPVVSLENVELSLARYTVPKSTRICALPQYAFTHGNGWHSLVDSVLCSPLPKAVLACIDELVVLNVGGQADRNKNLSSAGALAESLENI